MKKKKITIIVLACVACVLLGGYFALSAMNAAKSKAQETSEAVFTLDSGDTIQNISCNSNNLVKSFSLRNGTWYYDTDYTFPLAQSYLTDMTDSLSSLSAMKVIADTATTADAAKYGFEKPTCVVSLKTANGKTAKITFGMLNTATGNYYVKTDSSSKIYGVASRVGEKFMYSMLDMANTSVYPSTDSVNITSLDITNGTESFKVYHTDKPITISYYDDVEWYMIGANSEKSIADSTACTELASNVFGVTINKCVAYDPTDAQLSEYGITGSKIQATLSYTENADSETTTSTASEAKEKTAKMIVGGSFTEKASTADDATATASADTDAAATSYTYIYAPDYKLVFTVNTDDLKSLTEAKASALASSKVCELTFSDIDSYDMTLDGVTHSIVIHRDQTTTTDGDTKTEVWYTVDGRDYKDNSDMAGKIWNLHFSFAYITADHLSDTDVAETGTPYIKFVCKKNTGDKSTVEIDYYPYDSSFYLAKVNGSGRFLVNKKYLETVKENFDAFGK